MGEHLTLDNVHKVALSRFPELFPIVQRVYGSYYDLTKELPEAYPIFEDVFRDYVFELVGDGDDIATSDRVFSFIEEIALAEDKELPNLLKVCLIGPLIRKPEMLRAAWPRMGQATRQLARYVMVRTGVNASEYT